MELSGVLREWSAVGAAGANGPLLKRRHTPAFPSHALRPRSEAVRASQRAIERPGRLAGERRPDQVTFESAPFDGRRCRAPADPSWAQVQLPDALYLPRGEAHRR
ncbi:uncharacterized protein LOC125032937 [Penaeus chinensis]|uniref:uncharacterized protein LOC125032937 n=1 Tax=Penaeus chinensis TaxID=139456 RepID=UPI001FB6E187|nr:uncharacterized protein LOC125032937 [Penaeus chinensis]